MNNLATDFLDYALSHQFGDLHFKVDSSTGMIAIIAIHSTKLGPALGGCRFIEYADTKSAILDAMRLAQGMSYKAALAGLPLGGGKSVIIKPPKAYDRNGYLHAFGKFVQELGGRYITALDSGTNLTDMSIIAEHTPFVASLARQDGEPSPFTAKGTLKGIQAAVAFKFNKHNLHNLHIAIQGLGHVGGHLCQLLHEQGARLTVTDVDPERVEQACPTWGASASAIDKIHQLAGDVFSPCALGGTLNSNTICELQTSIVAGAANNQLEHQFHGQDLHDKGILYAPDYVINMGGLIHAANCYFNTSPEEAAHKIDHIYDALTRIFQRSSEVNRPCSEIADTMAKEILYS